LARLEGKSGDAYELQNSFDLENDLQFAGGE
jgi:hypothetical protein